MKILLVIDHLGLGGAQRQVVELACGLVRRGHAVEIFNYFPRMDFFRARVLAQGITVHDCTKGRGFSLGVLRRLRALIRRGNFGVIVSYLNSPNIYTELAGVGRNGAKLVVSERCSRHDDRSMLGSLVRRLLHGISDHVVTNSETHAQWLDGRWWLRGRVSCIYNGLDPGSLLPGLPAPARPQDLRLLAAGRVCPQKNPLRLVRALQLFHQEHGYVPHVSWAGKTDSAHRAYHAEVNALLANTPAVRERWQWLGEQPNMPCLLSQHHALIHPSVYEGLPNSVCEALGAGMPVLVSDVCDHPLLVEDGARGFIFDPLQPGDIAAAIGKLARWTPAQWTAGAANAAAYARENLSVEKMVSAYEQLALKLTSGAG